MLTAVTASDGSTMQLSSTAVARRLWAHAGPDGPAPASPTSGVDRVFTNLHSGLGRWIGSEGYRTLLDQALERARPEHPAIRGFGCLGADEKAIQAATTRYGANAVVAGMVAVVSTLIDSLGQIIGEEMAVRLVEQAGLPSPRGGVGASAEGGRRG